MIRVLIGFVVFLAMAGCASTGQSSESYLAGHPERPAPVRAAIRNGYIKRGMTREEVILVRGQPAKELYDRANGSERKILVYQELQIEQRVILENGLVTRIEQQHTPINTGYQIKLNKGAGYKTRLPKE